MTAANAQSNKSVAIAAVFNISVGCASRPRVRPAASPFLSSRATLLREAADADSLQICW
jgi:hypothetical protein